MKLLDTSRALPRKLGKKVFQFMSDLPALFPDHLPSQESPLLKTVGWVSAGVGALAIGVVVGREIRQRYKFNRRTPYDFYAHSGDSRGRDTGLDMDFGLGI